MTNRVQSSIRKASIFQLLTDFLGILIHSTWFYAFVEKLFTLIKAMDHFSLSTECSQHDTDDQTQNKHDVKMCYRAETAEAQLL